MGARKRRTIYNMGDQSKRTREDRLRSREDSNPRPSNAAADHLLAPILNHIANSTDHREQQAKENNGDDHWMQEELYLQHALLISSNSNKNRAAVDDFKMKGIDDSFSTLQTLPYYDTWGSISVIGKSSTSPPADCCVICKDGGGKLIRGPKCKHQPYCRPCLKSYLVPKIQENAWPVRCPQPKCKIELGVEFCKQVVPKQVCNRWMSARRESSVLAKPIDIRCLFEDCSEVFADDEKGFLCRACPNCWRIFCWRCKVAWHFKSTCQEYQQQKEYEQKIRAILNATLLGRAGLLILRQL